MTRRRNMATEQLVAVVDGPMHGQWFYLDEWRERLAAARRMFDLGQPPTACLTYGTPSRGDIIEHPHHDGVVGMAVRCGRES